MKKFLSIYQELNNTSHLWSNWGHTPDSLFSLNGEKKEAVYADNVLEKLKKQKEDYKKEITEGRINKGL